MSRKRENQRLRKVRRRILETAQDVYPFTGVRPDKVILGTNYVKRFFKGAYPKFFQRKNYPLIFWGKVGGVSVFSYPDLRGNCVASRGDTELATFSLNP